MYERQMTPLGRPPERLRTEVFLYTGHAGGEAGKG
jgi:hypothetical protein